MVSCVNNGSTKEFCASSMSDAVVDVPMVMSVEIAISTSKNQAFAMEKTVSCLVLSVPHAVQS
jgi:hypothetical protein